MRTLPRALFLISLSCAGIPGLSAAWAPVGNHIKTRWAAEVSPDNALPEYPRPQLVRSNWTNLNGLWDYAITDSTATAPTSPDGQILVPFGIESSLSGVGKPITGSQALWYSRTFTAPERSNGERLLLHFGAVDWDTTVILNGQTLAEHRGGYDPFTVDITDALAATGQQTLQLKVLDSTASYQPRGKQTATPGGIFYTSTTGIWQTAWLEKVPANYVTNWQVTPDVDHDSVVVRAVASQGSPSLVQINVLDANGVTVATGSGPANTSIRIKLTSPTLWSPDNPYLYGLQVTYGADQFNSYFGMRKIEVKKDQKGINRYFLNNEAIFLFGPLDQGFWPDGIYTAPTDTALRYDLEVEKKFGFNVVRKHVKVEPERWYYWADTLGLLVWQDFPSVMDELLPNGAPDLQRTPPEKRQIEAEMRAMIDTHRNHPSIIQWVSFNEGWGQYDTARIVSLFKRWDPTRLVDDASGWTDRGVGDVLDFHSYPAPTDVPLQPDRVAVQGEYGGGGLLVTGHDWDPSTSFQYVHFDTPAELQQFFIDRLNNIKANAAFGLSAAIYTQTTDVEDEINGLMTYDRAVIKIDAATIRNEVLKLYPSPTARVVLPSADQDVMATWQYVLQTPATNWYQPAYDDNGWMTGIAGFGSSGTPNIRINTIWSSSDIWLRRSFNLAGPLRGAPYLYIFYDDSADIYLNGQKVLPTLTPYQVDYAAIQLPASALAVGRNVLAIHAHQIGGGQGIDAGLLSYSTLGRP